MSKTPCHKLLAILKSEQRMVETQFGARTSDVSWIVCLGCGENAHTERCCPATNFYFRQMDFNGLEMNLRKLEATRIGEYEVIQEIVLGGVKLKVGERLWVSCFP